MSVLGPAILRFNKLTGIDIAQFVADFVDFTKSDVPNIMNFFRGFMRTPQDSFERMRLLMSKGQDISTGYNLHQSSFPNIMDWELMMTIEEIRQKLVNVSVLSKYLRSSIVLATYNNGIQESEYVQKQNQTLENISWSVLKSNNPNNDWVDVALSNDLREEDYTMRGGALLKISYKNHGTINWVKVVIDNIVDENILGKDIYQLLTFVDDDLQVLEPQDTVLQSAHILIGLKRGDNPEFLDQGVPRLVGSNIAAFSYPILFRDLANMFAGDDTFSDFRLENLKVVQDNILMEFAIETILGNMIKGELSL
jgi:hypothetical protein